MRALVFLGLLAIGGCVEPSTRMKMQSEGYFICMEERRSHRSVYPSESPSPRALGCLECGERFEGFDKRELGLCPGRPSAGK